jgi:signal transduction histidine kinase
VNLAANAIEVTPAGGRVSLYARQERGSAVLGVTDTGPGFQTFDPAQAFSQERPQVKDSSLRSGSTGFGLYIVGRIAAAHGGRAEARNLEGGGADVRMIFPLVS